MQQNLASHDDGQLARKSIGLDGSSDVGEPRILTNNASTPSRTVYGDTYISDNAHVIQGNVYNSYSIPEGALSRQNAKRAREDVYKELLGSLTFERMNARLWNIELALSNTCQWVYGHKQYLAWIDHDKTNDHHGFLWIKGKPGCGKSTIMKTLVAKSNQNDSRGLTLSYFFNARSPSILEKSSLGLYRSLTHQILCACPEVTDMFFQYFQSKFVGESISEWTEIELKNFLIESLPQVRRPSISIYIDALDEGQEDDVRRLISFLERLCSQAVANGTRLCICLSSRHYPHITIRKGIELVLDEQSDHTNDIQTYISNTLNTELYALGEEICRKSAGIFLWVVLVIPMLNTTYDEGADLTTIKKVLHDLPIQLDALFSNILKKNAKSMDVCISLLQWVLFSTRPLTSKELYVAILYSSNTSPIRPCEVPDEARLKRYILNHSRGLVEMDFVATSYPTLAARPSDPDFYLFPVVQFIHETVREFLLGPNGLFRVAVNFPASVEGTSHERLKKACLEYINFSHDQEIDTWGDYAHLSLFKHANAAQEHNVSQWDFLKSLRMDKIKAFGDLRISHFQMYGRFRLKSDDPLIFLMACLGLYGLVKCLLQNGADADEAAYRGTARLFAFPVACATGNLQVARLLLQYGASMSSIGDRSDLTALGYACKIGDEKVVRFLIDEGVDINAKAGTSRYPLEIASSSGSEKIVKLLLDAGAKVDAQIGQYDTTAQIACEAGHEHILGVLLEGGASPNTHDTFHGTLLQQMSRVWHNRSRHIAQILLKVGVDADFCCDCHGTALQVASESGNIFMVDFLLNAGASPDISRGKLGTALQMACVRSGNSDIVRKLLEAGADAKIPGGRYGSALHAACFIGSKASVSMLLKHGVEVPPEGLRFRRRVWESETRNEFKVLRPLLLAKYSWIHIVDDEVDK